VTALRLRTKKLLGDLTLALGMGIVIAVLCVPLAWLVPLELSPPRVG
jgi:hypothetical protein